MEIRKNFVVMCFAVLAVILLTGCPPAEEPADTDNGENGTIIEDTENPPEEPVDDPVDRTTTSNGQSGEEDYMAAYIGGDADPTGSQMCQGCHSDKAPGDAWTHTALLDGDESSEYYGTGCEQCHGPGGNHNGNALGILNPEKMPIDDVVVNCSQCHTSNGAFSVDAFRASIHYGEGISCVMCHNGHSEYEYFLHNEVSTNLCGNCHNDNVIALAEGTHGLPDLICVDCHNPHE